MSHIRVERDRKKDILTLIGVENVECKDEGDVYRCEVEGDGDLFELKPNTISLKKPFRKASVSHGNISASFDRPKTLTFDKKVSLLKTED